MRYALWLPLRIGALILLPTITVFGFFRALLRSIGGADETPPSPMGCLMQFILLPIYAAVIAIYYIANLAYSWVVFLDVKLGFAKPEELQKLYKKNMASEEEQ